MICFLNLELSIRYLSENWGKVLHSYNAMSSFSDSTQLFRWFLLISLLLSFELFLNMVAGGQRWTHIGAENHPQLLLSEICSVQDSFAPKAEPALPGNSAHINESWRKAGFIGMEITHCLVSEACRMKMAQVGLQLCIWLYTHIIWLL